MKVKEISLYTNGKCIIFGEDNNLMEKYQSEISHDKQLARRLTDEAQHFYMCRFKDWLHEISREEMQFMLGVHDTQYTSENSVCYECAYNVDNKCNCDECSEKTDAECQICGQYDTCLYYNGVID